MKVKIEIDLDDDQLSIIKDIVSGTGPVRRFPGVWWDRADFLVLMDLVKMTACCSLWDIKLTEPGQQVYRLLTNKDRLCEHSEPRSYPEVEQARSWCFYISKYLFLSRGNGVRFREASFSQGVRMH